jgi:hypothetical protein
MASPKHRNDGLGADRRRALQVLAASMSELLEMIE